MKTYKSLIFQLYELNHLRLFFYYRVENRFFSLQRIMLVNYNFGYFLARKFKYSLETIFFYFERENSNEAFSIIFKHSEMLRAKDVKFAILSLLFLRVF